MWEPAAAPDRSRGCAFTRAHVLAHDLIDYHAGQDAPGLDFLRAVAIMASVQSIVTDPPFEAAEKFVEH